jgi:alpha-L-arabinofuranosidase
VKCYLDGRLVHDVNYETGGQVKALYASATRDENGGDVIVKVVNASAGPLETKIDLSGAKNLTGQGRALVLTSENPTDENTIESPTKVSPKADTLNFTGSVLARSLPGNSFTVLRLNTR